MAHAEGQQHPISIYFTIWGLLFVLSALSYAVDYYQFQGYLRWTLIIVFMMAKASLIVAFFMHMIWERRALIYALLFPTAALMVFIALMSFEGDYTFLTRGEYFSPPPEIAHIEHH